MAKQSPKSNVYALLIGIDAYREDIIVHGGRFPALSGCVNDANDVLSYLQADDSIQLNYLFLKNEAATKTAIVEAFRSHLSKASSKDVVLIYYSGHGTCEEADTSVWTDQRNNRLEAIVCYYDNNKSSQFLLTDKELRFLIHELYQSTKAHILTLFDCCHSGDNTRAVLQPYVVPRRVDFVFPQRKWDDFIFAPQLKPANFMGKMVSEIMPQGAHVQFSAAESDEPAVEINGHGVFTTYLLEALRQTDGNVSYLDLHSRLRNKMRVAFEQKPKLYAPNEAQALLRKGFMKKSVGKSSAGTLVYNEEQRAWVLNRGVLHGVAQGETKATLKLPGGKKLSATADVVELDSSLFQFDGQLDKAKSYRAALEGVRSETVKLRLVNRNALLEQEVEVLLKQLNGDYVVFTDNAAEADYDLVMWNSLYYLTKPNDWARPIVAPVEADAKKAAATVEGYLLQIANWHYFNKLKNTGKNALPNGLLKVEFSKIAANGTASPLLPDGKNAVNFSLDKTANGWEGGLKIVVTNRHSANLYVAGVYLSEDFSSQPVLFEPNVKMLEPGQSEVIWDANGGFIPVGLDSKLYWYNWQKGVENIKFIYSTTPFEADQLKLEALPMPQDPDKLREEKGALRTLLQLKKTVLSGWNSIDYQLVVPNPTYNLDNAKKAEGMFQLAEAEEKRKGGDPSPGFFASELYFVTEGLNATKAISAKEAAKQKGVFWDVLLGSANKWAGFWRNRRYHSALKQLKGKPTLIAKGDSWFQHPLLDDIIDYVGRFYPVFCLSAAGDTIRNYLKEGDFIKEIENVKPAVLLLSGGGNDILGESMRKFLAETFPENPQAADFFTPALRNELSAVIDLYKTIFDYYQDRPGFSIVVHGYDYVRPLPPGTKKMSWIGKYLDERHISDLTHRSAAVHYLMDNFNADLKKLASKYDNVHYLDLRGTVADNQWDDEIHPDNDGFQNVSLKFIRKVNELTANGEL